MSVCFGVIVRVRIINVAFALVPAFKCALRPVIQALVFFLLCVSPHLALSSLTGPCPVGFAGRNHYI